jgi:hypothetical protein
VVISLIRTMLKILLAYEDILIQIFFNAGNTGTSAPNTRPTAFREWRGDITPTLI